MRTKMMTREDIQAELGWSDEMLRTLLPQPDSPNGRRDKSTGSYSYGLYRRDRVLILAETPEVLQARWHWNHTVRGYAPAPGWTMRLGDIGQELGVTAVAVGKILDLMGLRSNKKVTEIAVVAGCGLRRWDGDRTHHDWHLDRTLTAIKAEAARSVQSAIAEALDAAVERQQAVEQVAARETRQQETEATQHREEKIVMAGLVAGLIALRVTDPAISLIIAVEYVTADPGQRLTLFRRCSAARRDATPAGEGPDGLSAGNDLAFLERRATAEGFRVAAQALITDRSPERSGPRRARSTAIPAPQATAMPHEPFGPPAKRILKRVGFFNTRRFP